MSNPYCKNLKTIIFDIETMGLMPYKDMVINAGFCDPETGDCFQLFAESKQDEERLILVNRFIPLFKKVLANGQSNGAS